VNDRIVEADNTELLQELGEYAAKRIEEVYGRKLQVTVMMGEQVGEEVKLSYWSTFPKELGAKTLRKLAQLFEDKKV